VVLDFAPQVLAQVATAVATGKPDEQRAEQAVILIGRAVEQLVVDTNGVPPVEQIAQLILQSSQLLQAGRFLRHSDIVYDAGQLWTA
jgi:hypothetical protein